MEMFISRHRIFYKYRLINSVRHLPVLYSYLLLTVLLSQSWTEGMVLYSLGMSPCSCLSLWLQLAAVKCYVSTVSCLPVSLPPWYALIIQMSSAFTEEKGGGKESKELCLLLHTRCPQSSCCPRYSDISAYLHLHLKPGATCENLSIAFPYTLLQM